MKRLYFAYGSNMDPRQMRVRCPDAVMLGTATLAGHRFLINGRGVATLERCSTARVMGVLWNLTEACELSLDHHEGLIWGFYQKLLMPVLPRERGAIAEAIVYIDPVRERGFPREGYLEKVLLGARRAGIPESNFQTYFNWAKRNAA